MVSISMVLMVDGPWRIHWSSGMHSMKMLNPMQAVKNIARRMNGRG